MDTEALKKYIKSSREEGKSSDQILNELTQAGWNKSDVENSISDTHKTLPPPPPPGYHNEHLSRNNMWDSFENILLFISLYIVATSIGIVLHVFVDNWIPSAIDQYDIWGRADSYLIRGATAALLVSTPLFVFFFLRVTRASLRNPELRKLHSRKLLTYLTLIVTFIIVVWNVIKTVYDFLGGDIGFNSLAHFCVTVGISSVIFLYYLHLTKEDRKIYA